MSNCCDTIVSTLNDLGITRLFGLVGGEVLDLIESCRKHDLEFITTRHESMAAYMAEVTGQLTGLPGVCVSTLGPGASNMINGVANAFLDRQPVLAFAGQLASDARQYANHQVLDLEAMYAPVVKKTFTLTADGIADQIREGFELALAEPRGPVFFCLSKDVNQSEAQEARPVDSMLLKVHPRSLQRLLKKHGLHCLVRRSLWFFAGLASAPPGTPRRFETWLSKKTCR